MTTTDTNDQSTVTVQCTVSEYQRSEWQAHANELGMSLSEFIRCMTQAGRNGFTDRDHESTSSSTNNSDAEQRSEATITIDLVDIIREQGPTRWDTLMSVIETQVDEAMNSLQSTGTVLHSGKEGGYIVPDS